jgi:hypothetical protein
VAAITDVLHKTSDVWSSYPSLLPDTEWQGVWESSSNDVWLTGDINDGGQAPVVWHAVAGDGATPPSTVGPSGQLETAWGSSAADVWAVGTDDNADALLCHYDGGAWGCALSSDSDHAYGVWGRGSSDVWVSADNAILHWNGQSWSRAALQLGFDAGTPRFFRIWGDNKHIWAAGDTLVHCP